MVDLLGIISFFLLSLVVRKLVVGYLKDTNAGECNNSSNKPQSPPRDQPDTEAVHASSADPERVREFESSEMRILLGRPDALEG